MWTVLLHYGEVAKLKYCMGSMPHILHRWKQKTKQNNSLIMERHFDYGNSTLYVFVCPSTSGSASITILGGKMEEDNHFSGKGARSSKNPSVLTTLHSTVSPDLLWWVLIVYFPDPPSWGNETTTLLENDDCLYDKHTNKQTFKSMWNMLILTFLLLTLIHLLTCTYLATPYVMEYHQ